MTISLLTSPTTPYYNHHHPLTFKMLQLDSPSSLSSPSLIRDTSSKAKLLTVSLCSTSSSSTPLVEEQDDGEAFIPDPIPPQPIIEDGFQVSPGGCKACGRDEIERGCNGEGRIQGGIATVPGFGWWPIKAYRPCPGFVASGGRYRRTGQSMDEVAFGRGGRATSVGSNDDEAKSSKKRKDPKRFKR